MAPAHSGKYYSVNVPLNEGTTDDTFHALFKPIMRKVMETFQPSAIVMQCGEGSACVHCGVVGRKALGCTHSHAWSP